MTAPPPAVSGHGLTPGDWAASLRAQGYPGEVGLLITDLEGRELYALNPDRVFPAASTIKVPLLVMALEAAQAGQLDLRGRVTLRAQDRVPGSGVLHELGAGLNLTWEDVLTLMVIVSDNTATNLLIERLGLDQVGSWLEASGLGATRLIGSLQLPPERRNAAQRRGERNRTSARDQVTLLASLARGEQLDPAHTALALSMLERQQQRDLLGRHVPRGEGGDPFYRVMSKSGELNGVHHDVGVLYTPRPLVVALLSEGGLDPREHPDNRDVAVLASALWPLLAGLGGVHAAVSVVPPGPAQVPSPAPELTLQGDI